MFSKHKQSRRLRIYETSGDSRFTFSYFIQVKGKTVLGSAQVRRGSTPFPSIMSMSMYCYCYAVKKSSTYSLRSSNSLQYERTTNLHTCNAKRNMKVTNIKYFIMELLQTKLRTSHSTGCTMHSKLQGAINFIIKF